MNRRLDIIDSRIVVDFLRHSKIDFYQALEGEQGTISDLCIALYGNEYMCRARFELLVEGRYRRVCRLLCHKVERLDDCVGHVLFLSKSCVVFAHSLL